MVTFKEKIMVNNIEVSILIYDEIMPIKFITVSDICKLLSLKVKRVNSLILKNIYKFKDDFDILDIKLLDDTNFLTSNNILTQAQIGNSNNLFVLSCSGFIILTNLIENLNPALLQQIIEIVFQKDEFIIIEPFKRKEHIFIDLIEPTIYKLGLTIERQKYTNGYYIDAYIPEINLAIEYDENSHLHYDDDMEQHREIAIKNSLGCKLIRVTDQYDISVALSKVIHTIIKLMPVLNPSKSTGLDIYLSKINKKI